MCGQEGIWVEERALLEATGTSRHRKLTEGESASVYPQIVKRQDHVCQEVLLELAPCPLAPVALIVTIATQESDTHNRVLEHSEQLHPREYASRTMEDFDNPKLDTPSHGKYLDTSMSGIYFVSRSSILDLYNSPPGSRT